MIEVYFSIFCFVCQINKAIDEECHFLYNVTTDVRYAVRGIVLLCSRPGSVDGNVFMGTFRDTVSFLCRF